MKSITSKGLAIAMAATLSAMSVASIASMMSETRPAPGCFTVDSVPEDTSHTYLEWLPGTHPLDTASLDSTDDKPYQYIKVVARTYGDSIVLRWAINSYPDWRYLVRHGVNILRHIENENDTAYVLDTIARGLKPLALEEFRKCYPDTIDSLAYMAMGAVYGKGALTPEETDYHSKSLEALIEVAEDQKMYLIAGLTAAERRPDLANALALRFTDRNVKRGKTYSYFIQPTLEDTTGHYFIVDGIIENLKNEPFKSEPYNVSLKDSITGHCQSILSWNDDKNGFFEIWRRSAESLTPSPANSCEWQKVNRAPYAPPFDFAMPSQYIIFSDSVPEIGTYEYRVQAHDAFGDLTPMSDIITVRYPDLLPPAGPDITRIVIDRPDNDPAAKVYANIYFHKDSMERDFTHYMPLYANSRDSLRQWRLLSNQYVAPTDTVMRIDVTHTSTGMITIAAVDTAGNMGYAMPKLLRVADLKPPSAPKNLKADVQLDGTILLTWEMEDTLDLHYYDILFANSPDHEFTLANYSHVYTRSFMDTVALDANERYIYYCVRGVDWAMNQGETSDTLRVLRPNASTPSMAHLDSAWVDDRMIHTRWVGGGDEIIGRYEVYRRNEGARQWQLLRTLDADSVRALGYVFQIDDAVDTDHRHGYEYAVQTVSLWGLTSGLTPALTMRPRSNYIVDFPLRLDGTYDAAHKVTKIAWEADNAPTNAPYFFCVWRQGPDQDGFSYMTDAPATENIYTDYLLEPGQSAQYRVSVRFRDGRKGPTSNIITVTAP